MAIGTGAAILGGSVLSGVAGAKGASDAADAQTEVAEKQIELHRDIYDDTVERFEPFLDLGTDYSNALRFELLGGDRPMIGQTDYEIETVQGPAGSLPRVAGEGAGRGGYGANALGGSTGGLDPRVWKNPHGPMTTQNLLRNDASTERGDTFVNNRQPQRAQRAAPTVTQYKVGGQTFGSMADAQAWVDANSGGSEYQGFQATPGYQFALDQGQAAIDNSAASRGNLFSGATLKAQQEYGTGMANQEYGNYLNRLMGQASQGQAAAANTANAGANYGSSAGTAYANMGNAQAAGHIGQANALTGGINNAIGAFGYMNDPARTNFLAPTTSLRPQARPF